MRITKRISTLLTLALAAVMATALPADAGSWSMSKSTGRAVQTYWTQVDGTAPGTSPVGNVHSGWLYAYEVSSGKADVFVWIDDWDCEPGELPYGGGVGIDDDEPEPSGCTWVGNRTADGFGLAFTLDRKLTKARLKGQLTVYGGGHGPVMGRPQADIVWTGIGNTMRSASTWRFDDGASSGSERLRSTDRNATMSGFMGPMGFDPDLSGGYLSTFSSSSKTRTR